MPRLLIVDDDAAVCEVITEAFREKLKVNVQCASCARKAAQLIAVERFDVLLIDAVLPDISGFFVARLAVEERMPTLLMSGHPEAQAKFRSYGFPALEKPFRLEALFLETMDAMRSAEQNLRLMREATDRIKVELTVLRGVMAETRRLATAKIDPKPARFAGLGMRSPQQ